MKTNIRNQALLLGATLLGTMLFAGTTACAVDILQTSNQVAGRNWIISPSWGGPPGALPVAGNNYFTPAGFDVRTPDSQTITTPFAGDSLQIEPGGRMILKNGGALAGIATGNVKLNGGSMNFNTSSGSTICAIGGTLQVLVPSVINSLAGAATRDIWLRSDVSGSGDLSVGMNNITRALVLFGTNSGFSGNWTVTAGRLEIATNSLNALGAGTVTLDAGTALTLNATNDLVVTNLIGGAGSVVKLTANTVTLSGNNSFTGSAVVSNGVLKLASSTAISSASVISLVGGSLDASLIGGLILNDTILQSMNGNGTVVGNLTATTGTTNVFTMTTATNDILNVTGSLTLNGTPTLQVIIAGLKPSGTYRLINYTGAGILGGGAFNLVPPAGSPQTFSLDYTTAGQVNLIIVGDPKVLTWVGDGGANAWDTSTLVNWTNSPISLTNFSQGDYVTFNDSGSTVPDINVAEAVIPSSMTVSNTSLPYVFTGLGISSDGTLTKAGTNDLVLNNDGNNFNGPVDIRAGVLSIGSGLTTGSLGNPSSITNNGGFRVNKGVGSTATTVNGPISGSGAVEVTGGTTGLGGATLNLNGTNSYTGLTTVGDECQLLFTNSSGLGSASGRTIVLANGRLGITTLVGAMTLAEPLTLNGSGLTTGNNQGGALYMLGVSNNLTLTAPITIASDARVRVIDNYARMTFANTVLGTNVALRVSVGSQPSDSTTLMTFSNTVSIGSGVLTKDGQGAAAFASASNVAGSTTVNEGTLLANNAFNGGPVTVNAGGTVGGSGTILRAVTVGSAGTLSPGNAGIGTLTLSSTLALNAAATTRMEINRTNAQNADSLVVGSLPMNGTLTVVNTGPDLQVGDTFTLFASVNSGAFTATNLPALAQINHYWDTSLLVSQGKITVALNSLPVLPLVITDIVRHPTNVVLTWNSYPTRVYNVEYLLDVGTNDWTTLKANIPANGVTNSTTSAVDTTGSDSGLNNTLVQYQMGTADAQIQDATNTMAAGPLLNGGGLSLFNPNANVGPAYLNAPQLQASPPNAATTLVDAYNANAFFTFELTVGTNVTDLDFTSLSFNAARGGGAAPRGYGAYVILPDLTEVQIQGSTVLNTQRPVWDPQFINLTGVAGLQNLTNGQVVTFKIAIFTPQAANSVEFDDITVKGNLTPRRTTPYENSGQVFYRIKQQ